MESEEDGGQLFRSEDLSIQSGERIGDPIPIYVKMGEGGHTTHKHINSYDDAHAGRVCVFSIKTPMDGPATTGPATKIYTSCALLD